MAPVGMSHAARAPWQKSQLIRSETALKVKEVENGSSCFRLLDCIHAFYLHTCLHTCMHACVRVMLACMCACHACISVCVCVCVCVIRHASTTGEDGREGKRRWVRGH